MASNAQASSITSDMWVYQLRVESLQLSGASINARSVIPAGAVVPSGCSASPVSSGDMAIDCDLSGPDANHKYFAGEAFEIDLAEARLGYLLSLDSYDTTIAFNENQIVCTGVINCVSGTYGSLREHDNATGRLSYDISVNYGDEAWDVSLDPAGGSFSGYIDFLNFSGSWNYGSAGSWRSSRSFGFSVNARGSAVLVSAPAPLNANLPLPAAGWMMLAALGLMVGVSKRRAGLYAKLG